MTNAMDDDGIRQRATQAIDALRGLGTDADVQDAKPLVVMLRNRRAYALMGELAELISRRDPDDRTNRRLYAQYLIDTGKVTAAIDVLQALAKRLPAKHWEVAEVSGLLARAYKQIFADIGDKGATGPRAALKKAIALCRAAYDSDRGNTWAGVNLVALLTRARMLGMRVASDCDPRLVAQQVIETIDGLPLEQRDEWCSATLAEASMALGNWDDVERHVNAYAAASNAQAFHIASTLRQFVEIWDIERSDRRGQTLVDILRARLLRLERGAVVLESGQVQRLRMETPPHDAQLEAVLGRDGPQTYRWWKTGLERALSVAAIRQTLGSRIGTGFLVRAGDVGREPTEELMVLTNYHVVNDLGANDGIRPADAEIVFEAVDPVKVYTVAKVEWSSPPDVHDASLLRLTKPVTGIDPLPLATVLPVLEDTARVYVIGHPGGRDLAFSFQDNELIDHEGAPLGVPQIPGAIRLHYQAPTEGGSSGSPVFNSRLWQVIALHHKGGKLGMSRLNGKAGTYGANEGIAIQSIVAAVKGTA